MTVPSFDANMVFNFEDLPVQRSISTDIWALFKELQTGLNLNDSIIDEARLVLVVVSCALLLTSYIWVKRHSTVALMLCL